MNWINILSIILIFIVWLITYVIYRMFITTAIILRSAGKMKTGNDLAEQVEDTMKNEDVPNYFQFYWRLFLKQYKKGCNCNCNCK